VSPMCPYTFILKHNLVCGSYFPPETSPSKHGCQFGLSQQTFSGSTWTLGTRCLVACKLIQISTVERFPSMPILWLLIFVEDLHAR
jgi:hypothetical protein